MLDFYVKNEDTEIIRHFENHSFTAYLCPAGVWTISYGLTGPGIVKGLVIDQKQSDSMFNERVFSFASRVRTLVKTQIQKHQFIALLDFAWNLGTGALSGSTLLRYVNNELQWASTDTSQMNAIKNQFLKWRFTKKIPLRGLIRRRLAEAHLYETGILKTDWSIDIINTYMR